LQTQPVGEHANKQTNKTKQNKTNKSLLKSEMMSSKQKTGDDDDDGIWNQV
jgi:hypothetical protein